MLKFSLDSLKISGRRRKGTSLFWKALWQRSEEAEWRSELRESTHDGFGGRQSREFDGGEAAPTSVRGRGL